MSIFSNREVAEKFFNIYFKALGPKSMDLTEKKFITLYEGGDVVFPLPSTLPSQLATTASSQTMWSFFGDLLSKVLGGGLSTAVDIAITYGKKLMQESSDFIYDSYVEWNVNVAKDVVLDAVTKGEIDISKSRIAAAVEQIVKDFVFPDFQEKDVFSFVKTELVKYRDQLIRWEVYYREKKENFYSEIVSSLNDINKILAHDAQYTEEQKRAMLKEPYAEFIRSYTTVDDFYKETVDKIIDNIAASVKERWGAEGEYTFWNGKADFLFRKNYSGGKTDEENGLKDGRMAAFRQIYSSAMWYLSKLGQGWAEEKWTEFKRREWGNDVGLGRMDVWNAQVGRMLGVELCRDPELRKLGLDSLKFKELAGAKAVKLANAALEAGVGASNIGDPRLKLLTGEDLYTGLRFMETDAKEILTSVLGGVSARGESLIGMLEKHMAQGNSEQELNWTGMMDRILKDSTFLMYQNIGENNVK